MYVTLISTYYDPLSEQLKFHWEEKDIRKDTDREMQQGDQCHSLPDAPLAWATGCLLQDQICRNSRGKHHDMGPGRGQCGPGRVCVCVCVCMGPGRGQCGLERGLYVCMCVMMSAGTDGGGCRPRSGRIKWEMNCCNSVCFSLKPSALGPWILPQAPP